MDADFKQSSSSVNHHYFDLPVRDLIKTQNSKKVNLVLCPLWFFIVSSEHPGIPSCLTLKTTIILA